MRHIAIDVVVVSLCVCVLDTQVCCAKMAEPIKSADWRQSSVTHALHGRPDLHGREYFEGIHHDAGERVLCQTALATSY